MTKIMLVEDDKSLREIYGVRLLAEGYDIVSAGDGELALAMAIKERPQLIIADIMMPKISGFDMLDILRSTTETRDIKVIMMTALSSEEQRARGEQLGADRYLVKSQVGIEDVVRVVHEVLGDAPGGQKTPTATPQPVQPQTQQQQPAPQRAATPPASAHTAPAPSQPAPQPEQRESSIPQPTAPFSSPRPASLGERVIQPLKDNPRTQSPDINQLLDKEMAKETASSLPQQSTEEPPTAAPAPTPAPSLQIPNTPSNEVDATAQFQQAAPSEPLEQQPQPAPEAPAIQPEQPPQVTAPQDVNDQLDQLIAQESKENNYNQPQQQQPAATPQPNPPAATSLPPVQPQAPPPPQPAQQQQPAQTPHPDQLQVPQRPQQ